MIKADSTGSAAVNTRLVWIDLRDSEPPIGSKVLLIARGAGIAVAGAYAGRGRHWTHWQGLPIFKDDKHGND